MSITSLRTITLPAGIGDAIWVLSKLANSGERFHFKIPDGTPQRGKQIFDLLPQVAESCTYTPNLNYSKIDKENAARNKNWKDIKQQSFTLSANTWLEQGKRLEKWLPDLPISYSLNYNTTNKDRSIAGTLLIQEAHYIGIYGSAYSNARHWGMWGPDEWFTLIRLMYTRNKEMKFVIIGAPYDNDLAELLMAKLYEFRIPYVNTIGQPLSVVIEILKRLDYFIGFPSGLSILNETLGKDGIMFYPEKLKPMMNAWAHPDRIASGAYKGCQLCPPEQLFDWIRNDYQLYKRL
jgi:ADP-heptose:LPS heptosyltransferase